MIRKLYLTLQLLLICSITLCADPSQKKHADSLYTSGKYTEAATIYKDLLKESDNAYLYYNLGNSYYRMGDMAHAILNYERATRRAPENADIRFNLSLARSKTIDKIASAEDFFLLSWFQSWTSRLSADSWGILAIISFAIILVSILTLLYLHTKLLRRIAVYTLPISIILCILFNIFAYMQHSQALDTSHAIIMRSVNVRSTPAESGTAIFELHEGTKVEIIDNTMKQWIEIELTDGKKGWIKAETIEVI